MMGGMRFQFPHEDAVELRRAVFAPFVVADSLSSLSLRRDKPMVNLASGKILPLRSFSCITNKLR